MLVPLPLHYSQEKSIAEPMSVFALSVGAGTGVPAAVTPRARRPITIEADLDLLQEDDAAADTMEAALDGV